MNKSILIVDDEESIRKGFAEILSEAGWEVFCASKVSGAWTICKAHKPDVVLVDYYLLDEESGIDFCQKLKASKSLKNTKVIMMTGVLSKNQAQKMLHFGFDKVLIKPVESDKLIREVDSLF